MRLSVVSVCAVLTQIFLQKVLKLSQAGRAVDKRGWLRAAGQQSLAVEFDKAFAAQHPEVMMKLSIHDNSVLAARHKYRIEKAKVDRSCSWKESVAFLVADKEFYWSFRIRKFHSQPRAQVRVSSQQLATLGTHSLLPGLSHTTASRLDRQPQSDVRRRKAGSPVRRCFPSSSGERFGAVRGHSRNCRQHSTCCYCWERRH
jgi:hypothetical protein